jgi:hypothetical protein
MYPRRGKISPARRLELLATIVLMLTSGATSLACARLAPPANAINDELLTAEQCIDEFTPGSVEPFEKALVRGGVVNTKLDNIRMTSGMCNEIIERTPDGSPITRAAAVGSLNHELQLIKESMEDASANDVNGDGKINEDDKRIAASASYAASQAAQQAMRRATEEGSADGGLIEDLDAVPVAATTSATATDSPSPYASPSQYASPGSSATASASAAASTSAAASASASSDSASATAHDESKIFSAREEAQHSASGAAREAGADSKAAAGGGQCAATVALIDASLRVARGYMAFKAPAKELRWKDDDTAHLVVQPKVLGTLEQAKQEVERAEGAGEIEAGCMQLGIQMKPMITTDGGLDIRWFDEPQKSVRRDESIAWRWEIGASEIGSHPLYLNVRQYAYTSQGGSRRPFEDPLFDETINVTATRGEVFADFIAHRWSVLVPIFLTILTAIIIPFVLPWWRRRNQPSEPRTGSSDVPRNDRWI